MYLKNGMAVKNHINVIYIKDDILKPDQFSNAVAVFMHELLHQYGNDCSKQFRQAILEMNKVMINHMTEISMYEEQWKQVGVYESD